MRGLETSLAILPFFHFISPANERRPAFDKLTPWTKDRIRPHGSTGDGLLNTPGTDALESSVSSTPLVDQKGSAMNRSPKYLPPSKPLNSPSEGTSQSIGTRGYGLRGTERAVNKANCDSKFSRFMSSLRRVWHSERRRSQSRTSDYATEGKNWVESFFKMEADLEARKQRQEHIRSVRQARRDALDQLVGQASTIGGGHIMEERTTEIEPSKIPRLSIKTRNGRLSVVVEDDSPYQDDQTENAPQKRSANSPELETLTAYWADQELENVPKKT